MAKGQFSKAQNAWLAEQLPEYIKQLDAGVRGGGLTKWKQSIATKALDSPEFADLDFTAHPRTKWFGMIVRKYTNYLHQIYLKEHPETPSASANIKANPLLKFSSAPSGRQLFARELHSEIIEASKARIANQGTNEAAAYQIELKSMWDALDTDEKVDWEAKAEDECSDVAAPSNQREFNGNLLLALRSLCQGGLFGDAEMVLFYAFRIPENGDLQAGTVHGHSIHNKTNFGGDELGTTYGGPWSEFAEAAIPREARSTNAGPQTHHQATALTVKDGFVIFPGINLDTIPLGDLRFLFTDYFQMCWNHKDIPVDDSIIPWVDIVSDPSKFYDTAAFIFPFPLKNPAEFSSAETLTLGQFFNSTEPILFRFRAGIAAGIPPSPPTLSPEPATPLFSPSPFNPATQSPVSPHLTPVPPSPSHTGRTSLSPPLTPVPAGPVASLKGNILKRKQPSTVDQEGDSDKDPSKKKKKSVKKIEAIAAPVRRSSRRPGKSASAPKKRVTKDGPKQKKGYALITDDEESSDE
ncbi:hypothetical protein B0H16DRAFT_1463993 [Mycena metata]|uniref:Uncharacterized protein n=1 Tax=Mycena metata TaxID=1033252 RepID=A0AAD7N383_9AGAR|nr:hypothetical protein B0H16DRAFT_1465384 [Mycena metata]KAJ7742538.1 hypothetical protein B0H16DRAFT_1463993 [Mycena metata]